MGFFQSGGGGGSPLTTKGDLYGFGADNARIAVGTIGQVLTPNSGQTTGVQWNDAHNVFSTRINYISNGKALVDVSGWSSFDDTSAISDGTGNSSANLTFERNTSDPMFGVADFKLTHNTTNAQYEGWSYDFTITRGSLGTMQDIEFNYVCDTGYADDMLEVWIYDDDADVLIQPTPYKIKATTVPGKFKAQFQANYSATTSSADNYRLILVAATNTTTAYNVYLDNFLVGPTQYAQGPIATDWKAATTEVVLKYGTTTATNITSYVTKTRRIGDSLDLMTIITFSGAANANGNILITLPDNLTRDTTKDVNGDRSSVATLVTGGKIYSGLVSMGSNNQLQILRADDTGATVANWAGNTSAGSNVPSGAALAATDYITITITGIPILGWSSSTQMSDSADTRVVGAIYTTSGDIAVANASDVRIDLATKVQDTHGAVTTGTSTWAFKVPVSGFYRVRFFALINSASPGFNGTSETIQVRLNKNGTNSSYISYRTPPASEQYPDMEGSTTEYLSSGDLIYISVFQDSGGTLNFYAGRVEIFKIQGPSAIAASEKVYDSCVYQTPTGTISNSYNVVKFGTVTETTHSSYSTSTGLFTCPMSKMFYVSANVEVKKSSFSVGDIVVLAIYKNGVAQKYNSAIAGGTQTYLFPQISHGIPCKSGDTLGVYIYSTQSTGVTYSGDYSASSLTISSQGGV